MYVNDYWKQFPKAESYWHHISTIFLLNVALIAIALNTYILYFIYRFKLSKIKNTKASILFTVNLALCDILKATFNLPMTVVSSLYDHWIFGQYGCDFHGFTGAIIAFSSIGTFAAMTIERYISIKNPLYSLKIGKRFVKKSITITWVNAFFWSIMPLFTEHGYVLEGLLTSCTFDYINRDVTTRYVVLALFFGGFIAPCLIIIIFYTLIGIILKNRMNEESLEKLDSSLMTENRSELLEIPQKNRDKRQAIQKYRTMKVMLVFLSMFCIAWLPYATMAIYAQFGSNREKYINLYTSLLPGLFAKTASIYNPIIYLILNKDSRIHLIKIFKKKERAVLSE